MQKRENRKDRRDGGLLALDSWCELEEGENRRAGVFEEKARKFGI